MKVLLFCPTRPEWPHLYGRTLMSIFRLKWDKPLDCLFMRGEPPIKDRYDRVVWKYQQGRRAFLRGDYQAMFTVEADMIVPEDALIRLAKLEADVAYGLYVLRDRLRWSVFSLVERERGKSLSEDPVLARDSWGKIIDAPGVGLGCTLIRRPVLEHFEFRRDGKACNDWYLSLDCQKYGFTQRADLGVVCGHMDAEPSPRILWPDPIAPRLYTIEYLGGEWIPVEPGQKIEVIIDRMGEQEVPLRRKE